MSPRAFFRRLAALFGRGRRDRELDLELEAHLAMHVEDNLRAGMTPEEARRVALVRLGGLAQTRERVRDRRSLPWIDALAQDLRYAVRMLYRSPGFTAVAVATLALGIGANSAVFSVIDAVLIRPLPFPEPDRLVAFTQSQSLPDLDDIAARASSFESIGGVNIRGLAYTGGDIPVQVLAGLCTARYFDVFRARAERGRLLTADDDRRLSRVAVVSHAFWSGALGSDPAVIGKSIPLSGIPYTIVGVLPAGARFPNRSEAEVFVPLRVTDPKGSAARGVHYLQTALRLEPGASIARAQGEIHGIDLWLDRAYPEENRGRRRELEPIRERVVGGSRRILWILFAAVGLVLLIACANFAGLLLARASVRKHEMAIRAALGAGSARLIRQLVTESLLLSLVGAAAGLALARLGMRGLLALPAASGSRLLPVEMNGAVFAFTAAVAVLTGLLFGLFPAIAASRVDFNDGLRESSRTVSASGRELRTRRALVVSEIALALVLLAGAGLLFRSFRKLREVEPGFRPDHVLTLRIELPDARYETIAQQRTFRSRLIESLDALPGADAALVSELPMGGEELTHNFVIQGRPPIATGEEPEVLTRTVTDGYFRALGIPLRAGRGFGPADGENSAPVAVVNESFVRTYFPGDSPVGALVGWARDHPPRWMTVVGVVGDVNHFGPAKPELPAIYDLYAQTTVPWKRWSTVVVHSAADPASLVRETTAIIRKIDPQLPVTKIRTMSEVVAGSTLSQKSNLALLGVFALVALTLASIGIYGLIAYTVARQRHDIGVRMALGADAAVIVRLIVGGALRLAAAGAVIGVVCALLVTRAMKSLLFGVGARDPFTLATVVVILAGVAVLASWIPARSATRVDPMASLRDV